MDIEIYKALSDESRLRILNILFRKELCVCEIESILNLSQTNVSRHLNKLKYSGLLSIKKESRWVYYSINEDFIKENNYLYQHLNERFKDENFFNEDVLRMEELEKENNLCNI